MKIFLHQTVTDQLFFCHNSDPSSVEDSEDEITLLGAITSENKTRKSKRKTAEEILAVQHEAQVVYLKNKDQRKYIINLII